MLIVRGESPENIHSVVQEESFRRIQCGQVKLSHSFSWSAGRTQNHVSRGLPGVQINHPHHTQVDALCNGDDGEQNDWHKPTPLTWKQKGKGKKGETTTILPFKMMVLNEFTARKILHVPSFHTPKQLDQGYGGKKRFHTKTAMEKFCFVLLQMEKEEVQVFSIGKSR